MDHLVFSPSHIVVPDTLCCEIGSWLPSTARCLNERLLGRPNRLVWPLAKGMYGFYLWRSGCSLQWHSVLSFKRCCAWGGRLLVFHPQFTFLQCPRHNCPVALYFKHRNSAHLDFHNLCVRRSVHVPIESSHRFISNPSCGSDTQQHQRCDGQGWK